MSQYADTPDAVTVASHHNVVGAASALIALTDTSTGSYISSGTDTTTTPQLMEVAYGSSAGTVPTAHLIGGVRVALKVDANVDHASSPGFVPAGTSAVFLDRKGTNGARQWLSIPNGAGLTALLRTNWWLSDPLTGKMWTLAALQGLRVHAGHYVSGLLGRVGSTEVHGASQMRWHTLTAEVLYAYTPEITVAGLVAQAGQMVPWTVDVDPTIALGWARTEIYLYRSDYLDEAGRGPTHASFTWLRAAPTEADTKYMRVVVAGDPSLVGGYQIPPNVGLWYGFVSGVFTINNVTPDGTEYRSSTDRTNVEIRHTVTLIDSVASKGPTMDARGTTPPMLRTHAGLNLLGSWVASVRDTASGGGPIDDWYILGDGVTAEAPSVDGNTNAWTSDSGTKSVEVQAAGAGAFIRTDSAVPLADGLDRVAGTVTVLIPGGRPQGLRAYLRFRDATTSVEVLGPVVTAGSDPVLLTVNAEVPDGDWTGVDVGFIAPTSVDFESFYCDRFGIFAGQTDQWAPGAGTDASNTLPVAEHQVLHRWRVVGDPDWELIEAAAIDSYTDVVAGWLGRGLPVEVQAATQFEYGGAQMTSPWGPTLTLTLDPMFVFTDVDDGDWLIPDRVTDHRWAPVAVTSVHEPVGATHGLVIGGGWRGDHGRTTVVTNSRTAELDLRALLTPTRRLWLVDHLGHVWKIRVTDNPDFSTLRIADGDQLRHVCTCAFQWREVA